MTQFLVQDELAARLRERGLRVTSQRLDVYEALASSGEHLTPEQVLARVRRRHPSISLNTVYAVLEALRGAGVIQRGDVAAGPLRFDANAEAHHHLVCRSCGTQVDVDCSVGERPCLQPVRTNGFVIDEAQVTFFGLCPNCFVPGVGIEP